MQCSFDCVLFLIYTFVRSIISENVEKWPDDSPLLISGHIHDKQQVKDNLIYVGSCMMHAFGESTNKTLLSLTFNRKNEKPLFEEIKLPLQTKVIKYMDIQQFANVKLDSIPTNCTVKFSVSGSEADYKKLKKSTLYKEISASHHKINFQPTKLVLSEQKNLLSQITNSSCIQGNTTNFEDILQQLVASDNNPHLTELCRTYLHEQMNN